MRSRCFMVDSSVFVVLVRVFARSLAMACVHESCFVASIAESYCNRRVLLQCVVVSLVFLAVARHSSDRPLHPLPWCFAL
jgi:hypothetical protein